MTEDPDGDSDRIAAIGIVALIVGIFVLIGIVVVIWHKPWLLLK